MEVTGSTHSSDGPGTIIQGNDISGTYNYAFPSQMGHAISISTATASGGIILPTVRIARNVIHKPADAIDVYGIYASARHHNAVRCRRDGGQQVQGKLWRYLLAGHQELPAVSHNDFFTGGTYGLRASSGAAGVQLENATFRDNRFDISTFGSISLDSTLVEDPIDVRGTSASCAISFSRGPVMDPDAPDGCSDFQTTAGPGFASADPAITTWPVPARCSISATLQSRPLGIPTSTGIPAGWAPGACQVGVISAPMRSTAARRKLGSIRVRPMVR